MYQRFKAGARRWSGSLLILVLLAACSKPPREWVISGYTMGTTYSVKIIAPPDTVLAAEAIKSDIDDILVRVNRQMSIWDSTSEISHFNRHYDTTPFPTSGPLTALVTNSLRISALTRGAFDITIGPLVDLWGFGAGSHGRAIQPPADEEIIKTLNQVGYRNIKIRYGGLGKSQPRLTLDLGAIAKGHGVDVVSDYLKRQGFTDYLVEIGGEVFAAGFNAAGKPWRIGIDVPRLSVLPGQDIQSIVPVSNRAVATSGDYRNYFEYEGKLYSHIVDPRTGYPVDNKVASATVVGPRCSEADAYATSLLVIGEEDGLMLIESLGEYEALLIIREGEEQFRVAATNGMPQAE